MDGLTAIGKAAADFGISSRTLRHWEAEGLIKCARDAQSGRRVYDEDAIRCIRTIDVLRRLDFSLAEVKEYMSRQKIETLIEILRRQLVKLGKVSEETAARKEAVTELIAMLEAETKNDLPPLAEMLLPVAVERQKRIIKKLYGGFKMESIKTLRDEVKIRSMIPSRTAAFKCVSRSPEETAFNVVNNFIYEHGLEGTARMFGFNAEPYMPDENGEYGFGFCATIPEGVEIPAPLYEMRLPGGLYGVISEYEGDPMGGWRKVAELLNDPEWNWRQDTDRHEYPGLEEVINNADENGNPVPFPMPVWFPVKKK
ncbi:MAG: MerR family transcriptional regulator [Defluviitaleaceae bacterium]|nr:MerR family transcriptional regulator [Defluviitaleaceae bacterium]